MYTRGCACTRTNYEIMGQEYTKCELNGTYLVSRQMFRKFSEHGFEELQREILAGPDPQL